MSYIIVDVEADGPIPHKYSMACFGAVILEPSLTKTFYGQTKPISDEFIPEALAISGFNREQHLLFPEPQITMNNFKNWIKENSKGKPIFISDNPFGFSARRIGDLYCGMKMDTGLNHEWKKLYRKTIHDHNPVNDAKGNAEALLEMKKLGLKIPKN